MKMKVGDFRQWCWAIQNRYPSTLSAAFYFTYIQRIER